MVRLRARPEVNGLATDLDFVVIDGDRQLSVGRFTDLRVPPGEATRYSQTFFVNAYDFGSFFAAGKASTLRVTRATRSFPYR